MPFLTRLDSRAAVKGSRDPLGIQPMWTKLGRDVVGNLTTVSNSVADFAVLLLGFYFIETIAESKGSEHDSHIFLKWEQMAAYGRGLNNNFAFRGTERVRRRLDSDRWKFGADSEAEILSDQKTYGLWGLYTVPAKSSGLIQGEPARLTHLARKVVQEEMLPALERRVPGSVNRIIANLGKTSFDLRKHNDGELLQAIGTTVSKLNAKTLNLFRDHLLHGGESSPGTRGHQRVLAELMQETLVDKAWVLTPASIRYMAKRAGKRGDIGASLAERLQCICAAESVLAPGAALFQYLLGCDGQKLDAVAGGIAKHWGGVFGKTIPGSEVEAWTSEMKSWPSISLQVPTRWLYIANALQGRHFVTAIKLTIEQNTEVMQSRGASSPWIRITDNKLDVRFKDAGSDKLPEKTAVIDLWRHEYFLPSLRSVAKQLMPHR